MTNFRKVGEHVHYRGSLISVATGEFAAPDGNTFERDIVHHPGAVSVVPVTATGSVIMVRQYRAAVDADILEIPAGKRDVPGEPFEETARRELAEEIGMEAGALRPLASFYNSPGFCDEHSVVFLATALSPCAREAHGVEEQHMTIVEIDLDAVPQLIARGELTDAKSIIGLLLARDAVGGHASP